MRPTGDRRPDVQGLRAIAVLLVVLFHAELHVPGGFTGVDVFFVISGFVICQTLLRELQRTGTISLRGFYARRIRRLLPALAVMVVVVSALGTVLSPVGGQRTGAVTGIFASLFTANAYVYHLPDGYFDLVATLNPLLHTWTLAVEEQFYLVFPTLLLACWMLHRRRRQNGASVPLAPLVLVGALAIGSFLLAIDLARDTPVGGIGSHALSFYGSPTRAWEFGLGALLALAGPWLRRLPALVAHGCAIGGIAAILCGAFLIDDVAHFPGLSALLPVGGTFLVIAAGSARLTPVTALLGRRPAVWLGDLSYSWYLWHWPLIVFAKALWPQSSLAAPLAALVSLAPSVLSLRLIENPVRRDPRWAGRRLLALGAACIIVPVVTSLGLLGVRQALLTTSTVAAWQDSRSLHVNKLRGCNNLRSLQGNWERCTWAADSARGTAVLIGDSNAGHFSEPFIEAANGQGLHAVVITMDGCPPVLVRLVGAFASEAGCARFVEESFAEIEQRKPDLVVLAARTTTYVGGRYGLAPVGGGPATYGADAKAQVWEQALTATLQRLAAAGIPAVVVHPVPVLPYGVSSCAVLRLLTRSCDSSVSREQTSRERERALRAESHAIAGVPGTRGLELIDQLCTTDRCTGIRDGVVLYFDGTHLSVAGARTLTDRFAAAIGSR